jgi:hypothetical protein
MRKKIFVLLILLLVMVIGFGKKYISYAKQCSKDIYSIAKNTNYKIKECGVKTSFIENNNGEERCEEFYNNFKFVDKNLLQKKITRQENLYCIEFSSDKEEGYIKYYNDENKNIVIQYTDLQNEKKLNEIENNINLSTGKQNLKFYEYLKLTNSSSNIDEAKNKILYEMKKQNFSNIEATYVSNGISITGFGGNDNAVKVGKKYVDFNCSISNYGYENYIIIGTPIIFMNY